MCSALRFPASFIRPRCIASSIPRLLATIMSTNWRWMSWNEAIGLENMMRVPA